VAELSVGMCITRPDLVFFESNKVPGDFYGYGVRRTIFSISEISRQQEFSSPVDSLKIILL
jgi:hypothetical protein